MKNDAGGTADRGTERCGQLPRHLKICEPDAAEDATGTIHQGLGPAARAGVGGVGEAEVTFYVSI